MNKFEFDGLNTPPTSWNRDQIKKKRLYKLDYPTILKQSKMSRWVGFSWGYHVWV